MLVDARRCERHAHAADVHHFHHVEARLLEEVAGAAVDLHAAADLVDQAQFFVGVGELAGERIELLLPGRRARTWSRIMPSSRRGLALDRFVAVGRQLVGLLVEPDAVEPEPAADAERRLRRG